MFIASDTDPNRLRPERKFTWIWTGQMEINIPLLAELAEFSEAQL